MKRLGIKLIANVLVFMFTLSTITTYAGTESIDYGERLRYIQMISGDSKGNLNEKDLITREELITIVGRMSNYTKTVIPGTPSFTDMPSTHWAYETVELAKLNGVTNGIGNNQFGTGKYVTYDEAVAMMVRVLGYEVKWGDEFQESVYSIDFPYEYVKSFRGNAIAREEVFKLMYNSLNMVNADGQILADTLEEKYDRIGYIKKHTHERHVPEFWDDNSTDYDWSYFNLSEGYIDWIEPREQYEAVASDILDVLVGDNWDDFKGKFNPYSGNKVFVDLIGSGIQFKGMKPYPEGAAISSVEWESFTTDVDYSNNTITIQHSFGMFMANETIENVKTYHITDFTREYDGKLYNVYLVSGENTTSAQSEMIFLDPVNGGETLVLFKFAQSYGYWEYTK